MIKFAKLPSAKWLFFYNYKSYHSKLNIFKIAQVFFVSFSVVRDKFERIESKFKTK